MTVEASGVWIEIEAEHKDFVVLSIEEFDPEELSPDVLVELEKRDFLALVDTRRGVIILGNVPNWLMCFLVYQYRIVSWVAVGDSDGAFVVFSHTSRYPVGTEIPGSQIETGYAPTN